MLQRSINSSSPPWIAIAGTTIGARYPVSVSQTPLVFPDQSCFTRLADRGASWLHQGTLSQCCHSLLRPKLNNIPIISESRKLSPDIWRGLFIVLAIFLSGRLGLAIAYPDTEISLFWLPTGIAVAGLFRWRIRLWPAVYLGNFLIHSTAWSSMPVAAATAVSSTIGPILTVLLLRRFDFQSDFSQNRDAIKLTVTAMLGMMVPASGGVTQLWLNGIIPPGAIPFSWITWWMGDTIGVLLAAPLVLSLSGQNQQILRKRWIEALCLILAMLLMSWFLFLSSHYRVFAFTTVIILIWAALRFCMSFSSCVVLTLSVLAALGTSLGRGSFEGLRDNLIEVWGFMATLVALNLIVTALQAKSVRANNELRASEERFQLVNRATFDAVWDWDLETNKLWWNEQFPILFGYDLNEFDFDIEAWISRIHPEDLTRVKDGIYAALESKIMTWTDEYRFRRKNGTYAMVTDRGYIIRNRDGKATRMVGAIRDFSEEHRVRQDLATTAEFLERTGEMAKVGGWELDLQTMKFFWSRAACRIHDIETNEPPEFEKAIGLFSPESRKIMESTMQATIETGVPYDVELPKLTMKGRPIWIRTQGSVVMKDGKAVKLIGALHDITERKRVEDSLRISDRALQSISQGVLITDANQRIISANTAFTAITGYTEAEVKGENCRLLQGPLTAPDTIDAIKKAQDNATEFCEEILHYRKDRTSFWNELTISPVQDSTGQVTYFVVIIRDITTRKTASDQLRNSEQNLAITLQSIGDALIATDSAGLVTRMNITAETLTGWSQSEALGRPFSEIFHLVDPHSEAPMENSWGFILGRDELVKRDNQVTMLARNGPTYEISLSASSILDPSGRREGVVLIFKDITEEFRVKRDLATTAELLERTGAMAKIGGWELDLKTMKLFWSKETCRIHEIDSFIAPPLEQAINFYPPEARTSISAAVQAGIDHGTPYNLELPLITAKGQPRWVRTQGSAILENGKTVKLLGAFQDITERKSVEESLKVSDRAIQSISQGVIIADTNRLIVSANAAFTSITGYSEAEIKGKNCRFLQGPLTDPLVKLAMRQAQDDLIVFEGEVLNYRKDGSMFWNELTISPVLEDDGRLSHFIGIIRDISNRKKSERIVKENEIRFRTLSESSPFGIFRTDKAGKCTYTNRRWQEIFGMNLRDSLGNGWTRHIHPIDKAKVFDKWQKTIALSKTFSMDFRVQRRDGTSSYIFMQARPVILDDQSQVGYVGSVTDISKRKQIELELLKAKETAETASKIKSEFLTTMSHEIRTPMNGIIGMTSLMLESSLTTSQQEMLEAIRESGEALMTIINDILDLSKIEAKMLEIIDEEFDLASLIDSMMDIFAHRLIEKDLELVAIIHPDVPTNAMGDFGRLRQVLLNLVGNAIKFTETGEVVLTVSWDTETMDTASPRLCFQVRDTGIGLTPEQQKIIFHPFSQANASSSRSFGGTGLGLIISKRLVELMGGEIGMESESNVGSTFWFTLPNLVNRSSPPVSARSEYALVLESHSPTRISILSSLQAMGIKAEPVLDGDSMIEKLLSAGTTGKAFDTIILSKSHLDRKMIAALKKFRASNQDKIIRIALTVSKSESLNPDFDLMIMDALLSKPIKRSNLFSLFTDRNRATKSAPSEHLILPPPSSADHPPIHVLLVEDNHINTRLAVLMLEKLGHTPDIAINGRKAVEAFLKHTYDLILMDCHMPEMDGYETTRQIRQIEASREKDERVKIIALTASAMRGERERCFAAGMDEQIIKPLTLQTIETLLHRIHPRPQKQESSSLDSLRIAAQDLVAALGAEAVVELLNSLLTEAPKQLTRVHDLAGSTEQAELHQLTHTLLGNFAIFGLQELKDTTRILDTMAIEIQLAGQTDVADKLLEQFEAATKELKQLILELDSNGKI